MALMKKLTKRGFTLIELMIVVVIIGILASLAIYGVQKYVASSKSAEAKTMLGRISKDMLNFYEGENQNYAILAPGGTATISQSLCPPAAGIPGVVPSRAKIQPSASSFRVDPGWSCLKTLITTPVYYQYSVASSQTGTVPTDYAPAAANDTFTAIATGNLDGDAVNSVFRLGGRVTQDGSDLVLILATTVEEENPEE